MLFQETIHLEAIYLENKIKMPEKLNIEYVALYKDRKLIGSTPRDFVEKFIKDIKP